MQAIQVKYIPATAHRNERYKAIAPSGSITVALDYALDDDANQLSVARQLAAKNGWPSGWISLGNSGVLADQSRVFTIGVK